MKTYSIARYGTRNWAVYEQTAGNAELICVTVYLKGARKVVELLNAAQETVVNSKLGKEVA